MADVFISYAREDSARAEQVARALEGAGLQVFWDSEIPPGQTWADYIEGKLTACRAVVVLWSENSTRSQWVREEARMGRDKGKLIPVMLDNSPAPFGFGEVQAANLSSWTGEPAHPEWSRTLAAVRDAVSSEAAPRATESPQPSTPRTVHAAYTPPASAAPKRPWFLNPFVLVGGTVVAVIAVLGVIGATMDGDTGGTVAPEPPAQPTVQQQRNVQAELDQQLAQVTGFMQQEGFQLVGTPFVSSLQPGTSQDVPVTLHTGYEYRIVAVCDNDCSDIDLRLFDENSNEVATDVAMDDQPVVQVAPRWTGAFSARVFMASCAVAPCYYSAQLYGRAAQ